MASATQESLIRQQPPVDAAPPEPTEESSTLDEQKLTKGVEAFLQSETILRAIIEHYPKNTPEQWDHDAITTRTWLEQNSWLISQSLREKLLDQPYSKGDLERQVQLLHETIEGIAIIRQADADFNERQDQPPAVDLPARIALNRARLELAHTIASQTERRIEGGKEAYVSWEEVADTLTGMGVDPSRGAINLQQHNAIHAVYEMYASGALRDYAIYLPSNPEFRSWVEENRPKRLHLIETDFIRLYGEWYNSASWSTRRSEIEAPLQRAYEELGVDSSIRGNPLQASIELTAAIRADLASDDLPYDAMREPLQDTDRTTAELLRQINASGRYTHPCDSLVQAKLSHANRTIIDIIAGLLRLQQDGRLELDDAAFAHIIDSHARTAAFLYVNSVQPLPPHERGNDLAHAKKYNEALKSFMIADGLLLAAEKADQLAA